MPGWSAYAVVDKVGRRRITADQAVERREDKGDPVLFLIDPLRAGAGLDGIYSAAREKLERWSSLGALGPVHVGSIR